MGIGVIGELAARDRDFDLFGVDVIAVDARHIFVIVALVGDDALVAVHIDEVEQIIRIVGAEAVCVISCTRRRSAGHIGVVPLPDRPHGGIGRDVVVEMQHVVIAAEEVVPFQVDDSQLGHSEASVVKLLAVDNIFAFSGILFVRQRYVALAEHIKGHPCARREFIHGVLRRGEFVFDRIA